MLAPFRLVVSATLAAKAVVSSEVFGALVFGWVVSSSQAGVLRLPRLRARTFLFVASATLAAKAGVARTRVAC